MDNEYGCMIVMGEIMYFFVYQEKLNFHILAFKLGALMYKDCMVKHFGLSW